MSGHLFPPLSNIRHPLEGVFYLVIIAIFVRWIWPNVWNDFLYKISADKGNNLKGFDE